MSTRDPRIDDLPESIKPVAEHLGYAAAVQIVDVFPGYQIYVPRALSSGHMLEALGPLADQLVREFGGEVIVVPLQLMTAEARARKIRQFRAEGLNPNEIAGRVSCSRRRVLAVLAGADVMPGGRRAKPHDPRQIDLIGWLDADATKRGGGA